MNSLSASTDDWPNDYMFCCQLSADNVDEKNLPYLVIETWDPISVAEDKFLIRLFSWVQNGFKAIQVLYYTVHYVIRQPYFDYILLVRYEGWIYNVFVFESAIPNCTLYLCVIIRTQHYISALQYTNTHQVNCVNPANQRQLRYI